MSRITVIGEALVDLFAVPGERLGETSGFTPRYGGAPANLAVSASKLGGDVSFIGRVGADGFGDGLKAALSKWGVDTSGVVSDPDRATMLACVALPTPETPEFLLLPGANVALSEADVPAEYLARSRIVAYGSVTLAYESARAVEFARREMRRLGGWVVFDVNLRPNVWPSIEVARLTTMAAVAETTVLKLNVDECDFLLGTRQIEQAARRLLELGPDLVAISLGADGAELFTNNAKAKAPGFAVDVVDATGAGDAFLAGVSVMLAEQGTEPRDLTSEKLAEIARFANAAGALAATQLGAIDAEFSRADVVSLMGKSP